MSQSITSFVTGALLVDPASPFPTREAHLCFESLLQAASIGIAISHIDRRIFRSNVAFDRMLGYRHEELKGLDFRDCVHPEDLEADSALVHALLSGERDFYKLERRYLRKDNSVFWASNTSVVVRTEDGVPLAIIDMLEDITQYRQAQEQLLEAQKMEAIGRLVGAVAHDFNNLLTGIMLYCDLMSSETEPNCRLHRHASEIHLAAEHGAALVRQLLTVARKHVVDPTALCLTDTITSMSNLLNRLIGEQVELAFDLDPVLPQVLIDPTHAQQIILNLVLNSRDAMPAGGHIVISTKSCEQPTRTEGQTRQLVALAVADDGCGMDEETQARLFEPFFTTKEVGKELA